MTIQECDTRDRRLIDKIQSVLRVHDQLRSYDSALQVSIENATIVVRGELPSGDLKSQLIPAVRSAGVLDRVSNCVRVAG